MGTSRRSKSRRSSSEPAAEPRPHRGPFSEPSTGVRRRRHSMSRSSSRGSTNAPSKARVPGYFYMSRDKLEAVLRKHGHTDETISTLPPAEYEGCYSASEYVDGPLRAFLKDLASESKSKAFAEVGYACIQTQGRSGKSNELWVRFEAQPDTTVFTSSVDVVRATFTELQDRVHDLGFESVMKTDDGQQIEGHVARVIFSDRTRLNKFVERDVVLGGNNRRVLDNSHVATWSELQELDKTIVVHGASGSGKTLSAIVAAACVPREHDPLSHVCVYVVPSSEESAQTTAQLEALDWFPAFIGAFNKTTAPSAQRNTLFVAAFKKYLVGSLGGAAAVALQQPRGRGGTAVVVFDEMGGEPWATRAIIAARNDLQAAAREVLKASEVQIVVAGTGAAGTVHEPGSLPTDYAIVQPKSDAAWSLNGGIFMWAKHIDPRFPPMDETAVGLAESTAAKRCVEAVRGNSRFAMLFINTVEHAGYGADDLMERPSVIEAAMARAAWSFKGKNSLGNLSAQQLRAAVVDALAATRLHHLAWSDYYALSCKWGLLEDRAVSIIATANAPNTDSEVRLDLPAGSAGQRFGFPRAMWVIVRAMINDVERAPTGEGLEESIADWLRWNALTAARSPALTQRASPEQAPAWATPPPTLGTEGGATTATATVAGSRRGDAWTTPWEYQLATNAFPAGRKVAVHTVKLARKLEPGCGKATVTEVRKQIKALTSEPDASNADWHQHIIVVNGDQSAYADVMEVDFERNRVTLWQSKRLTSRFPASELKAELGKMGCPEYAGALLFTKLKKDFAGKSHTQGFVENVLAALRKFHVDTARHKKAITKALKVSQHWVALEAVLKTRKLVLKPKSSTATPGTDDDYSDCDDAPAFTQALARDLLRNDKIGGSDDVEDDDDGTPRSQPNSTAGLAAAEPEVRFAVLVHSAVEPAALPDTDAPGDHVALVHSKPRPTAARGATHAWHVRDELYPVTIADAVSIASTEHSHEVPVR